MISSELKIWQCACVLHHSAFCSKRSIKDFSFVFEIRHRIAHNESRRHFSYLFWYKNRFRIDQYVFGLFRYKNWFRIDQYVFGAVLESPNFACILRIFCFSASMISWVNLFLGLIKPSRGYCSIFWQVFVFFQWWGNNFVHSFRVL